MALFTALIHEGDIIASPAKCISWIHEVSAFCLPFVGKACFGKPRFRQTKFGQRKPVQIGSRRNVIWRNRIRWNDVPPKSHWTILDSAKRWSANRHPARKVGETKFGQKRLCETIFDEARCTWTRFCETLLIKMAVDKTRFYSAGSKKNSAKCNSAKDCRRTHTEQTCMKHVGYTYYIHLR